MKDTCTEFLFSTPSFLSGLGTTFNVGGNYYYYNYSTSDLEADLRALKCDWEMVGKDMEVAIKQYKDKLSALQKDELIT